MLRKLHTNPSNFFWVDPSHIFIYLQKKKKQKKSQPVYAFSVGLLDVGEVFDSPVSRLPTISGGGGFPCNQNNTLIEKKVVNTKWQNITPFTRKK